MNSFQQFQRPTVSVSVKLYYQEQVIKTSYEITKDEINEYPWSGGKTGDAYFDDLDNDDDRFIYRVNDIVQHLINQDEQLDNWIRWEIQYWGEYDLDEFTDG